MPSKVDRIRRRAASGNADGSEPAALMRTPTIIAMAAVHQFRPSPLRFLAAVLPFALALVVCSSIAESATPSNGKLGSSQLRKLRVIGGNLGGKGGKGGGGGGKGGGKVCGTTSSDRAVSVTTQSRGGLATRVVKTNGCPGYPWYVSAVTRNNATESPQTLMFPLAPVMSSSTIQVATGSCKLGPIGVALNGVFMYSNCDAQGRDALIYEGNSFDSCGGHPSPTGQYHYHVLPGQSNPAAVNGSRNTNYQLCSSAFMTNDPTTHSPIVGFLADGIPIYGPRGASGAAPTDLDDCNGHATDLSFYHYHATTDAPYLVKCLKGCVFRRLGWSNLGTHVCKKATTQYDFSSLKDIKFV